MPNKYPDGLKKVAVEMVKQGLTFGDVAQQLGTSKTAIALWSKQELEKEEKVYKNGSIPEPEFKTEEKYLVVLERIAIALEQLVKAWK